MSIPQYRPQFNREKLAKEVSDYILSDGYFTEYKYTQKFEETISDFLKVKHCILVNNGTISLSLALLAYGIKPKDNVIIPNVTMFATQSAVQLIGANPIFVDIDPNNLCLDLEKAKQVISINNIKAVIYVTLNGRKHNCNEYDNFQYFCQTKNIVVIEDNAQSFGSNNEWSQPINCPDQSIGSFSFSMPKIITTGQGGCLVTNNDELARRLRKLKDFGREKGGIDLHDSFGINSKFTEIQAIMGLNQIEDINDRIENKKRIFRLYREFLKDVKEIQFLETDLKIVTPWFVDIYVDVARDELQTYLINYGIGTRKIYPPLTSQTVNNPYKLGQNYPISYEIGNTGLWLPSSMDLTYNEIKFICDKIKEFYNV